MITKIALSNIGNHQLTCQLNSTLLSSAKFATWIFRWKSRNVNRDNRPFVTKTLGGVHQGSPSTAHPSLALNRKIVIFSVFLQKTQAGIALDFAHHLFLYWRLTCSGDRVSRLSSVEELKKWCDGDVVLGKVLQLLEDHLKDKTQSICQVLIPH